MAEQLYFAYGSNMNLNQMDYRCPAASLVENVRLEDYRLAFCGRNPNSGVATIFPEQGSHVDGVLWKITPECEKSLDCYEGYPNFYEKQKIAVKGQNGKIHEVMVYIMNAPYKDSPARPSSFYLNGILQGMEQNGIDQQSVKEAVERTKEEVTTQKKGRSKRHVR